MVAEQGQYRGGYLGYPRFGIAVDVRHGDFLLKDPHQQHCNTELIPDSPDWTRLSIVVYYREKMQTCVTTATSKTKQGHKQGQGNAARVSTKKRVKIMPKQQGGGDLVLTHYQNEKRNLDLQLYIREETTDPKVIIEVFTTNVYEKPKIDFYIEPQDKWLDLGGNIGTFSLLALSRGCSVVTCEPEPENVDILEKNLTLNFPGGAWEIIPMAVTTKRDNSIDFYPCNGEYNKYRHTIYPKRGRSKTSVPNIHIDDLLSGTYIDSIKIDIEGAEIDILEHLTPDDYAKNGIRKMVFEYSFDVDSYIPRFLAIINKLRQYFSVVHYTKVKENEEHYRYFPAATIVYCRL
jgi:FkbM family methyltransferase